MSHLPLYSKKKNSQPMKTEPGSSQKKPIMLKQLSNSKSPMRLRDQSPISSGYVKAVPSNIIYDKQTLYIEVQELKKIINNLVSENIKLKTRLAINQTQKERLNKSKQKQENQQRYAHRPPFANNLSQIKAQSIKNEALKKQVKQLVIELEVQKKQNARIKRSLKYSKINELQIQLKTIVEENKHLFTRYQQLRMGTQGSKTIDNQVLESKFNKICKENKTFTAQIEDLNVEIMNLQSQLRIERAQKLSKEKSLRNDLSEEKKKAAIKLKQIIDFRRENSSMIDSKIRSFRAKEKLQQTSFKSHHVHVQPIRKNHIFNGLAMQKLDTKRGSSLELQQRINQDLLNENQKLRIQLDVKQQKLKEAQQKVKLQNANHIQSKPSAVPTIFSQNPDKQDTIKQKQKQLQKSLGKQMIEKKQGNIQVKQEQSSEKKSARIQTIKQKKQLQFITPIKIPPILKKSQSEREIDDQSSQSIQQTSKIKTQYLKQTVNLDLIKNKDQNKKLLKEIRQFLGYRFSYQKYRFIDLKKDIEASKVKEFSFIDVCHMLVNQPFYLNLEYCRALAIFIFEHERPKYQEKVQVANLLIKLRKIIKEYQLMTIENQFEILQNCIQLIKKNAKHLVLQFQQNKNKDNTIPADKLKEKLEIYSFGSQQIQYIITQVSIHAKDLHHIPYELILQRFTVNQSAKSSKREIIFQNGEEEKSNINSSQNSLLKRPCQNIDGVQPVAAIQNENIQQIVRGEGNLTLEDKMQENNIPIN